MALIMAIINDNKDITKRFTKINLCIHQKRKHMNDMNVHKTVLSQVKITQIYQCRNMIFRNMY